MKKRILALFLAAVMVWDLDITAYAQQTNAQQEAGQQEKDMQTAEAVSTEQTGNKGEVLPDTEQDIEDLQNNPDTEQGTPEEDGEALTEQEEQDTDTQPESITVNGLGTIPQADENALPDLEEIQAVGASRAGGLKQPKVYEVDASEVTIYEGGEEAGRKNSSAYASEWDSYSTNYYYNMLTDDQRAFWDQLDNMCLGYLTGTASAIFQPANSSYMTQYVPYQNMSRGKAVNTALMFKYSNPQYYFLDLGLGYTSNMNDTAGTVGLQIFSAFADGAVRAQETQKFKAAIDSWMNQINAQGTEVQKEKMAHDLIVESVLYDHDMSDPYNQVAYSVFCGTETVCAGYSQAFQLLCNAAGIDTAVVTSELHEWNIIRLNGCWYYVDCTWDDYDGEYGYSKIYLYFNRSFGNLTGPLEQNGNHTPEPLWYNLLPVSTQDSGAAPTEIGSIYTPQAQAAAPGFTLAGGKAVLSAQPGAAIYYTTNGTAPSVASTRAKKYTEPFQLPSGGTVKAIAVSDTLWDSPLFDGAQIRTYNVKFETNGGSSIDSFAVLAGAAVEQPAEPKRKGYTFGGWYQDEACTAAYDFNSAVNSDMTLYAKWTGNKYKVTLDANKGYIKKSSTKKKTITVTFGKKYSGLASPKRSGYVFTGWYTKKSGGKKITSSTIVSTAKKATLYAQWSKPSPKKVSIKSLKSPGRGKMTVKIKDNKKASGYEIRYSLKSSMASAKTAKASSSEKTISKLKAGKKYYVQVRMYQKESVSGKMYYGSWSSKKSIKVKK